MIRHGDRLVTGLLALVLLWAPLPFGSVTRSGAAGLEASAFVALALAFVAACLGPRSGARHPPTAPSAAAAPAPPRANPLAPLRTVALPLAALAGLALLGVVQSLPWPPSLLARASPEHARLFRQAASLLPAGAVVRPSLSLAASESAATGLLWAAWGAALAAAALVGGRRANRRALGAALVLAAGFQVVFGARGWSARGTTLWGVEVPGTPRLRGSFVNPDHLALYLELALAVVFAWAWWSARRAWREPSLERRVLLVAPPALLWLTLFTGLAFTGSRAGLASALLAVALQGVLVTVAERRTERSLTLALGGAAAAALGIGVVAAIGLEQGFGRLLGSPLDVTWEARRRTWAATWELFRRFPWTGAGLGSFRDAFPLVQPADLAGSWRHAHSDPLELLATAGLLGAALAALGLLGLFRRLLGVLRTGRRSEDRAAGLAALGALAALAIHEPLDFGLTLPANALTLAVLVGAAASARTVVGGREGEGRGGRLGAGRRRSREDVEGHPPGSRRAAAEAPDLEPVEPGPDLGGEG